MVPKDAQKRRKRRNPVERLFAIFLTIAFIFVVIGVCSVVFLILFTDANYNAPASEYNDDSSTIRNTKAIRSILSTYPTSGISFDGSRYINMNYQPSMTSETITFWVRIKDTSIPGRRTVVSTHDNLCSRQESSSVNGYSLFFEVLENSQIRFHVIYQSRRKDCDDFVVTVHESLNRWTHVAVIFNNLECAEGSSLCKMELSVYIGGVMQDKRIVTHRYRLDEMSSPISQIHVGSDVYGVSAFIGDIAALAFFNKPLDEYAVTRLSGAKTVSHEILDSLVRIIHTQNGEVISVNDTEETLLHLEPVAHEEIESLEKEEKENFATRRTNRRKHAIVSVTSSSDLPTKKKLRENDNNKKESEEPDWRDIRIEDLDNDDDNDDDDEEEEVITEAPKVNKPTQPDLPESTVDLQGGTIVYIDNTNTQKRRMRNNKKDIDIFINSLRNKDTVFLKGGSYHFRIPENVAKDWEVVCSTRIKEVKEAFQYFWKNYKQYAWGHDELLPLTKAGLDNNGHVGMTLIESLDTLWLLGMKDEFDEAVQWIATYFDMTSRDEVSIYEYDVRLLGGLLSAYELSKKPILLDKAIEVGDLILKAFDSRSSFPAPYIIPRTGESSQSSKKVYLSEVGSLGLELTHLSRLTHNTKYSKAVKTVNDEFGKMETHDGLYPDYFSRIAGIQLKKEYSIGESTLPFYEVLLKGYIQSGYTHMGLKKRFDAALEGIDKWLLRTSYHGGFAYIGMNDGTHFEPTMEQSTCSFASLYALNAFISPKSVTAKSDIRKARALAYTCYQMFKSSPSGLAADRIYFNENEDFVTKTVGSEYKLRSEVIEALYVLHETTDDPIYVEWGWEIFENIMKNCKTEGGFAAYRDVKSKEGDLVDEVQSFFPAKTLKYLYLLVSPTRVVELQKVLFTNGGHMLPISIE